MDRRRFLQSMGFSASASILGLQLPAAASIAKDDNWNGGELKHIIPTANHKRFLIKASFNSPRPVSAPVSNTHFD